MYIVCRLYGACRLHTIVDLRCDLQQFLSETVSRSGNVPDWTSSNRCKERTAIGFSEFRRATSLTSGVVRFIMATIKPCPSRGEHFLWRFSIPALQQFSCS